MKQRMSFIGTERVEWTKGCFYTSWSLFLDEREFLLGQNVKWVSRVLGIGLDEFFELVGYDDRTTEGRKKIGEWIVNEFKLTPQKVKKLEVWSLCCQ